MSVRAKLWIRLLLVGAVTACAGNPAPPGMTVPPQYVPIDGYGAWVQVSVRVEGDVPSRVEGELLAVDEEQMWVLRSSGPVLVARVDVLDGLVVPYDPETKRVVGATVLGTISTVSNGYFLVFTAPLWIIGGSITAVKHSRRATHAVDPGDLLSLRPFARFPQGMPDGIALEDLRFRGVPGGAQSMS